MKNAITYLRVSTRRQGASGLGIEAQRAAVETFCRDHTYRVVEEFVEIESGRQSDRPGLRAALARAKSSRALLVIAKLDRLARNVEFIARPGECRRASSSLLTCPQAANPLTLHILAAVAEAEARSTSERTKAALAAAKDRGIVLGNPSTRSGLPPAVWRKGLLSARAAPGRHLRDQAIEAIAHEIKGRRSGRRQPSSNRARTE